MPGGREEYVFGGDIQEPVHKGDGARQEVWGGGLKEDSFLQKQQLEKNQGRPAVFTAMVTNTYKDCMSMQVAEGVKIRRCDANRMNTKSESSTTNYEG